MELIDANVINQIAEFEFIVKSKKDQFNRYIVKLDKDDDGDCIKNWWEVYGVTNDAKFYSLRELANKLPVYTPNYDLQSQVEKIILDNE